MISRYSRYKYGVLCVCVGWYNMIQRNEGGTSGQLYVSEELRCDLNTVKENTFSFLGFRS